MVFHRQDVIWVDRNAHHSLVFYTLCEISWKWSCRKVLVFHTRASRRSGCLKAKNHQNFLRMSSNEPECATNWVPNAQNVQNHAFYGSKTRKRAVGNSETRMRKSITFFAFGLNKMPNLAIVFFDVFLVMIWQNLWKSWFYDKKIAHFWVTRGTFCCSFLVRFSKTRMCKIIKIVRLAKQKLQFEQSLAGQGSGGAAPGRAGVRGRSPWQSRGPRAQPVEIC